MRSPAGTARALFLMAAALLGGSHPAARADEAPAAPNVAKHQEALKSLDAEVENSLTIFRDTVKEGREQDGWSADVKEAALQWLKSDFRIVISVPPGPDGPAARQAAIANLARSVNGAAIRARLSGPAVKLADQLTLRIEVLNGQRRAALAEYAGELSAFAEDEWLKAEKPADLRSVTEAFAALDALAPGYLRMTNLTPVNQIRRAPDGGPIPVEDPRRVDAFYAALLAAGDDPLILPDPRKDVEAFTKARVTWSLLLDCQVPFQTRPRVVARVKKLDEAYAAMRASAAERLNAMILENAAPAAFEPALNYFNGFQIDFDPRRWGFLPGRQMPMRAPAMMRDSQGRLFLGRVPGLVHDYRDLLTANLGPMRGVPWSATEQMIQQRLASVSLSGVNRAYREWLDFRRAQVNGAPPSELDSFWSLLHERLPFLPREVKVCLEKRRAPPAPGPISPPSAPELGPAPIDRAVQPVEELLAALDAIAARLPGAGPANAQNNGALVQTMKDLPGEWKAVGGAGPGGAEASSEESVVPIIWQALAEEPDSLALFALREKAVRFVLMQLPARRGGAAEEKAVPVRKALEAALENCAVDGDWASFHRVLRLDSAAGLLARGDHLLWKNIGDALEQAAGERKSSPKTARARYATILQSSDNAAITALIARRLQELPAEAARP
jgi:hypothetical protein